MAEIVVVVFIMFLHFVSVLLKIFMLCMLSCIDAKVLFFIIGYERGSKMSILPAVDLNLDFCKD